MFKTILAFCAGAAIGSLATYFIVRGNEDEIRSETAESVKKAYGFYDQNEEESDKEEELISNEEASMYRKISKSYEYDKLFGKDLEPELDLRGNYMAANDFPTQTAAEREHPTDEDDKQPYVISLEEYEAEEMVEMDDGREYPVRARDKITLTYYEKDDTLVLDQNGEVLDIEETVGNDALNRFGEYEKDTVYVRNDNLGADYEVVREHGSYSKDVLGFDD